MINKTVSVILVLSALAHYKAMGMGAAPLHNAIIRGDESEVVRMLTEGASVDATTATGLTALHLAVRAGKVAIVRLILAKNPDSSLRNKEGNTAYDDALKRDNKEMIEALAGYNYHKSKSIFESAFDAIAGSDESDSSESSDDDSPSCFALMLTGNQ